MSAFPIRLFHAILSGLILGILLSIGGLQLMQRLSATEETAGGTSGSSGQTTPPSLPPSPPVLNPTPDDLDGDGMPNAWEILHHHNPNDATDAGSDFDKDGLTALQEYLANTDPLGNWAVRNISLPEPLAAGMTGWGCTAPNAAGDFALTRSGMDPSTGSMIREVSVYRSADGSWTRLPMPIEQWGYLEALDINDAGTVSVYACSTDGSTYRGFLWRTGEGFEELFDQQGHPAIAGRLNQWDEWLGWSTLDWASIYSRNGQVSAADPS